jgi:beta-barrel assembly-enhancing protease
MTKKNWLKTQQTEWAFGSKLAANAEQNVEMITDVFIVEYLNQLEQRIVNRSELPGCFVVKILIDPEPNAYSLPGGFIYVTSGLVQIAESEAELAGALAHETAHVTLRHMTRFQAQTRIWRRFALFSSPVGYLLRRYLGPPVMFSMIRKEEFEADRLGMRYQMTAGYDYLEFCRLLQRAIPDRETRTPLLERLYDTHPETRSRVKRLQSLSRHSTSTPVDYLVNSSEFDAMEIRFANLKFP